MILNEGIINAISFGADWQLHVVYTLGLLLLLTASYLLGSINTAILISRLIYKEDIRTYGSGNAGMTNMLRTYGKKAALLTLVGDMLKATLAIFITGLFFGFRYTGGVSIGSECYLAGLFAVLGHVFPVYYKFKGGKGVLVTATMALILTPLPFAILLLTFIIVVAISGYVSLGSVIVASLFPIIVNGYIAISAHVFQPFILLATLALAVFVIWCHRGNLVRIKEGTERKISFKKTNKEKLEEKKEEQE